MLTLVAWIPKDKVVVPEASAADLPSFPPWLRPETPTPSSSLLEVAKQPYPPLLPWRSVTASQLWRALVVFISILEASQALREKKSHLEEMHLDKSRSPWDHRPGFLLYFPLLLTAESGNTSKPERGLPCYISGRIKGIWPCPGKHPTFTYFSGWDVFAKCQCYLQNVAVFILICKYHSCELWPFPGLGIRVGIGEVVKADTGRGTPF